MESLKIGLNLEAGNIKKTAKDLKQSFLEMSDALLGKKVSERFASLQLQMDKSIQKSDELRGQMKALEGTKVPSDEYIQLQKQIGTTEQAYTKLLTRQEQLSSNKKAVPQALLDNIQTYKDSLDGLYAKRKMMYDEGTSHILGEETQQYARLSQELQNTNNKMAIQYSRLTQLAQAEGHVKEQSSGVVSGAKKMTSAFIKLANATVKSQKNLVKLALTKIKDFFKGGSKGVENMDKSFKKGLKSILMYGFGIRGLFRLFNKLRGYAKDALGTMSKQFDDVNRDMSALASKFSQFKNSIGTMVQPIIHALVPALITLMNALNGAMTKIGEFFAVLTGQKYIYKATEANIDYAKSLDKDTKSTKKNTKAVKDNQKQLGYYDKLNVIGQDKDKDTTPDTGAGDGTGNVESGFIKADPTKAVSEFAKKVKEAWKKADFTEVGNIIGKKLQKALQSIPWDGIKKMSAKIGKSLATLINGFVETNMNGVSLGSTIGKTIAEGLNTAITGLNAFVKNLKWDSVAKFITDGLNTAIKTIDWKMLGETIGLGLSGILTILSGFFNDTDWAALGKGLATGIGALIKNLDVGKIASTLSGIVKAFYNFFNGVFEGIDWDSAWETFKTKIKDFFTNFDFKGIWEASGKLTGNILNAIIQLGSNIIKDVKAYFEPYIKQAGGNIIVGLFNGILNVLKNLAKWIYNNIFSPFVKGFAKAFGIKGSTSSVLLTLGTNLMKAFLKGLKVAWEGTKAFIKSIPGAIKAIFKALPSFFKTLWNGIKTIFSVVGPWFGNIFSNAWKAIKNAFTLKNIKAFFKGILDGIKTVFVGSDGKGGVISFFKTAFSNAWKSIKGIFSKGGELFDGIVDGVADTFKSLVQSLIDGINSVIAVPFKKINSLLNSIRDIKIDLPKPLKDIKPFSGLWSKDPLPVPKIPKLAQGAVIPPNHEFLAMLGDQKQGTNIETPLDTMIEAFRTALGEQGGTANQGDIVVQINGREIARAVRDENSKQYKQTGAFMPRYS